jgi:hypothetical protein
MSAPLLLLLAVLQAAPAAPPSEGRSTGPADPSEAERQREAAERDQVNWERAIALPDLRAVGPMPELRRLRVVNRAGRAVTIDRIDYPGGDRTEIFARTLRPGARATLTLTAPEGSCRVTLQATPPLTHRSANLCRNAAITLRR